jgi:hypothetical protein
MTAAEKWYNASESIETHTLEANPLSQGHHITFLIKLNRTWVESLDRRQKS